ncbi:MAG: cyclodeaminase/cyclohydrolase family protein [Candidatus Thalassarchaeaceae archaeon]|jgi:formiminotetrahydrofolate cyclodeaminase|nr:cyclodeaminase/cyclohydrolase family protein [Candidatus Thalassarchaeaceae archaeon]|tara:strand:- start:10270 stop:10890 length:621 start_codon:yes stop_codon:yes gene_type:complete
MNEGYSNVLESIASSDPTPGGGSVAALALAHAHALALMVSRLTSGRERWKEGHDAAEKVISSSETGMKHAQDLAWEDAAAFNRVMDAYRMPKDSDNEKEARKESINSAIIGAALSPMAIVEESLNLLRSITELAKSGNSNALTDLYSSAELARTAASIASLNVRINLDSLTANRSEELLSKLTIFIDELNAEFTTISDIINERLGW